MANEAVSIRVDMDEVQALFRRAPEAARKRAGQLIQLGAITMQRRMIQEAPVFDGAYRQSIKYKYSAANLEAVIGPDISYALPLETGSKPHWVSVKPGSSLRKWAEVKGIDPYAIRQHIATHGTKANPVVKRTYDALADQVQRDIAKGITKFAGELDNGRI